MRVCIVTPSEEFAASAGVRIRYDRLANAARYIGHDIAVVPIGEFQSRGDLSHDSYVFAKTFTPAASLLAWRMRQNGKLVGVDIFDDYFTQVTDTRMLRYRSWLASMAGVVDFFLCSTERLAEAIRPLTGGKPLAVISDPCETLDIQQLDYGLAAKRADLMAGHQLRVLWFGIGDNPYFNVGIRDLVAFSSGLARLRGGGRDVSLRILTNVRALNAAGLAMLRRLPVPSTIEEWTPGREKQELRRAHVCFLPVNGQPFSRVKSLNRAVTALAAGCQVLTAGFPLYEALQDFVYDSAEALLADLERQKPRLRPETLAGLINRIGELANPYSGAEKMFQTLAQIDSNPVVAVQEQTVVPWVLDNWPPDQKFPVDVAVVHGAMPDAKVHKLVQRLNGLAIKGPACRDDWNCHVRFDVLPDGKCRVTIEERVTELMAEEFRARLVPYGRIKDLVFYELPSGGSANLPAAGCYLLQWNTAIKQAAAAPILLARTMTLLGAMFPSMHFINNDKLAAVAPQYAGAA